MSNKQRVAAAHVAPILLDPKASAAKACEWIALAGKDGSGSLTYLTAKRDFERARWPG